MSVTRSLSSPFASVASIMFNSLVPSGSSVSSVFQGFRSIPVLPPREVLVKLLFHFTLRPPPPPPIPLSPPPTRVMDPYDPYMVSQTIAQTATSTSRRFHSASTLSGDILSPVPSLLMFMMAFIIGVFGFGFGSYLVFSRASRGARRHSKSVFKSGIISAPFTRFFPALGTTMRIVAASCCIYGVIHVVPYLTLGARLASNPHIGILLVDVEPPALLVLVDNLRQLFNTFKNCITEVVREWVRDRGVAYVTTAVATFKDITDALVLAWAVSGVHQTSNTVLRDPYVGCGGATFDLATKTWSFPNAGILHRLRELIHTTVTAVLEKPTYDIECFVPVTHLITYIQYFTRPTIENFSIVLMGLLVVNIRSAAVHDIRNWVSGKLSQYTRIAVALVAAPRMNVEAPSVLVKSFKRITAALRIHVGPVPRVASLAISESYEGSYSETSDEVSTFEYAARNLKSAPVKRSKKNIPALRIDTQSILNSASSDSTDSSSRTTYGHSDSDLSSRLTGELTPATSVPDISQPTPLPKDAELDISTPLFPQLQDLDRPALASGASSSATDPLVASTDKEGEWTVVAHKKWKRRTYDAPQPNPPVRKPRHQTRPWAGLQDRPPRPASPPLSSHPSEASAAPLARHSSSKLSLGSSGGNRPPSCGSVPKPTNTSSSTSSSEVWYTCDGEVATEETGMKFNAEWFPRFPSQNTPLPPLSAWSQGPNWESQSQPAKVSAVAEESVKDQGVEEPAPSCSKEEALQHEDFQGVRRRPARPACRPIRDVDPDRAREPTRLHRRSRR
ncbi:hypothetical protein BD410DRAFT_902667 [Rickenella mellea]|uniref:Uncharacterized protein n=1 Tax=Rickenella mellea TaxID=50990 RepID=A0A4Y7PIF0_9AGAM|nr:hypothetical protein BD410DRAFT_902667 [Rickenella mellea]